MRKFLCIILSLVLSVSIAFAVGGGGGGGGGNGGGGGSFGGGGSACSGVCNIACTDNGAVAFTAIPALENVTVTHIESGKNISVPGIWRDYSFESDEAVLNEKGAYRIGGITFSCPGLAFSCRLVNITIKSCKKIENSLVAEYAITNLDTTDRLEYQFLTSAGRLLFYEKNKYSTELASASVAMQGGNFVLTVPDLGMTKFQISVKNCGLRYQVFASLPCIENASAEEFPCANLISTYDRVRCRLAQPEYELEQEAKLYYLPEECRALGDDARAKCISIYKSVQKCWVLPQGNARVGCVKQQINLGDFKAEKDACITKPAGERGQCIAALKGKMYTVIKFRFYDLEERAEEYKSRDLSAVTDFVTSVEVMKQEFNKAGTAEEKRNVILRVRELWKEFLSVVKK